MLRLEGAAVEIAGAPVLRGVSLQVPPGGRVALIGRNGAGKTTTLRALMGLLPLQAGRLVLDGQEAGSVPAHHRARLGIGYAPEERKLFGSFTVQDNLLLPAQVLGLPKAEVSRRLEAVYALLPELKDFAPRKAAGLSGGQGKMVALGRALMVGTRAVLLDEPFQGLAPALAFATPRPWPACAPRSPTSRSSSPRAARTCCGRSSTPPSRSSAARSRPPDVQGVIP